MNTNTSLAVKYVNRLLFCMHIIFYWHTEISTSAHMMETSGLWRLGTRISDTTSVNTDHNNWVSSCFSLCYPTNGILKC